MSIAALIFDMDGVVARTDHLHFASWQRLAREEGVRFDASIGRQLLGRTREDSLALFAGEHVLDAPARRDWLDRKQRYFLEALSAMGPDDALPGVHALIDEARGAGLPVGLASSSRNVRVVLERLGLTTAFHVIADGSTVPAPKPAPDVFLWVAERLQVAPNACVVFEDSAAGIAAAVAGGFRVVALGTVDAPAGVMTRPDLTGARLADFA